VIFERCNKNITKIHVCWSIKEKKKASSAGMKIKFIGETSHGEFEGGRVDVEL
jgi:hypothetical protein